MSIVDFIIHLEPELPLDERDQLESEIGDMDGVMSAHFCSNHLHLMEVAYNPDVVSSSMVLGGVRQHGVVAQKIGL